MPLYVIEWINWIARWIHLIAGISWIGSSFYFVWLDSHLNPPEKTNEDVEGELWMVHSGGFYQVEKRLIKPGGMPKILHWFKWEATFTLISGLFLVGLIYYLKASLLLIGENSLLSPSQSIGLSIFTFVVSWLVYDCLWQSRLAKFQPVATALSVALLIALFIGLTHFFSGRAAFVHAGGILGTIMVINVWVRILPAQQKMIDATEKGITPDYSLGKKAKLRSMHNSYMTFPVLFMMLSNHYPSAFGHQLNWVVLILLFLLGASSRHMMISKTSSKFEALVPAVVSLGILVFMTAPAKTTAQGASEVPFSEIESIVSLRCMTCHASQPTDSTFGPKPGGIDFTKPGEIERQAERIHIRAVLTRSMPLGNKTGITDAERKKLGQWYNGIRH